ncbi:MAG: high-potential iron-sulfur protein [Candidatus Methanofastidiosia archaeon]
MKLPDFDRIGEIQKKRLEKVRKDQEKVIREISKPHANEFCGVCKFYLTTKKNTGFCKIWKKEVSSSFWCQKFKPR